MGVYCCTEVKLVLRQFGFQRYKRNESTNQIKLTDILFSLSNINQYEKNKIIKYVHGCGFTSHSAIFQLHSDETVVQFPNFDLLPGTQRHGQLRVFSVPNLPDTGTGTSEDVFNILAIRGPTRGEGMPGIEPGSSDPQSSPLPLRHRGGQYVHGKRLTVRTFNFPVTFNV